MRAVLLSLLLTASAPPDILPPGHKSVRHEIVVEWDGDTVPPGHHLVASPTRGFGGHHDIRRGEPFGFSSKYGTRIYLVPDGTEFQSDSRETATTNWPNAPVPVAEVNSIAAGHPLARIETTVQVVRVTGDGIDFEPVAERRFDAGGGELGDHDWLALLLIATAGAVLLAVLAQRRFRVTPPANP